MKSQRGVICRVDESPGTRIWGLAMHVGVPFMQNPVYSNCLIINFYWVPSFYRQLFYAPPTVALTSHWNGFTSIPRNEAFYSLTFPPCMFSFFYYENFFSFTGFLVHCPIHRILLSSPPVPYLAHCSLLSNILGIFHKLVSLCHIHLIKP